MSSLLNIQNLTIHPNYPKTKIKVHAPDRIGLVGFHDKGFVIAKPAEPYSAWLQERCRELHNRITGSYTNLTDGLKIAVDMMSNVPRGIFRRIWLLTDGYPNVQVNALMPIVEKAHKDYININTIGFGDTYDEMLLRRISSSTHNGKFMHIQTLRELTNALVIGSNGSSTPNRHHHRSETTILAIDLSPSMKQLMDGIPKISIVEEAVLHLLHYKQQCFS